MIYVFTFINQMILNFATNFINIISIFGLILSMIGSIFLVKPFILSNSAIQKLGEYKQPGTVWGQKEKIEINQEIIKSFQDSRNLSFIGISYLFVGFSLQLIQYLPKMDWSLAFIVVLFVLGIDFFILSKMKKKNKELRKE